MNTRTCTQPQTHTRLHNHAQRRWFWHSQHTFCAHNNPPRRGDFENLAVVHGILMLQSSLCQPSQFVCNGKGIHNAPTAVAFVSHILLLWPHNDSTILWTKTCWRHLCGHCRYMHKASQSIALRNCQLMCWMICQQLLSLQHLRCNINWKTDDNYNAVNSKEHQFRNGRILHNAPNIRGMACIDNATGV